AGRVPVSAALGELRECPLIGVAADLPSDVAYVKWGLSGLLGSKWDRYLLNASQFMRGTGKIVLVGYADWVQAEAPRPAGLLSFLIEHETKVFMLDTFHKGG